MYYIILYDLYNGLDKLESVPLTIEPTDKEVQDAARLYGAKLVEVINKSED